ncbi:hypothetical protein [Aestuariispira insulae]|uniref:hypothetical protein n=1 Tax=Aestuariispira insulae TaxID=1461337 RepID=UPI0011C05262|nr:hypothetical protein [Aestuariispira insulae]
MTDPPNKQNATRLRRATEKDAAYLAQAFIDFGDGITESLWQDNWWVSTECLPFYTRLFASGGGFINHKNCIIAEENGRPVGMFMVGAVEQPTDISREHPFFQALYKLIVPDEVYVLGFYGNGTPPNELLAFLMLRTAEEVAVKKGRNGLNFLLSNRHDWLRDFLIHHGYQATDHVPLPEMIGAGAQHKHLELMNKKATSPDNLR